MAMLVAYLNNKMHKPNNMRSEVEKVLDQNDTVKGANAKYQEYIRKNVKEWNWNDLFVIKIRIMHL